MNIKTALALATLAVTMGVTVGCRNGDFERNVAGGMKTPETSRLFVKYVEPTSGAVSYMLKPGLLAAHQQAIYFTHRSMTEDGRFLVLWTAEDEFPEGVDLKAKPVKKSLALVDFMSDEAHVLQHGVGSIPFLDTKTDVLYYPDVARQAIYRRNLLEDPDEEIEVVKMPPELLAEADGKPLPSICCHLTLTKDRTKAFLDAKAYDGKWVQGLLDLETGAWEKWGESDFIINHGQINPVRDDLALCAHEVRWQDRSGAKHSITNWNGVYPRLQLVEKGRRTMIPPGFSNYATHEHWTIDGEGFYWCNHELGGETYYDLETGTRDILCPIQGYHSTMSDSRKYVVFDHPVGPWYRGCHWMVRFWNRETSRPVTVYAKSQKVCDKTCQSTLHPDPHPQFVCGDRYIVSTFNGPDGHMNVMVTPVAGLAELTATPSVNVAFADLPETAKPGVIARRLAEHFLETPADDYKPRGYTYRNYGGKLVEYPLISLWVNALEAARTMKDADLEGRLVAHFEPFLGEKSEKQSRMTHVDFSVFGALPLEIALLNGDSRCRELGLRYADTQWTPPSEGTLSEKHAFSRERQEQLWEQGYTPQTRLWIDDMYMITLLQSQAWRLTGDMTYLDRAAKEMAYYLDELQLKEGPAKGLFYHAPDVHYVWGRGDGWMAAGMALNLKYLPRTNPWREKILCGYRKMMSALLKFQRADGLWGQLVDEPSSWGETSGSAMFTYAFVEGVKNGWLEPETYGPAARKAYLALVDKLDEFANLKDVCIGTGKRDDHQYYLDRPRKAGDPHGQAALMWICAALLDTPASTAPTGLSVEYREEPVGVDAARPRFSWKLPEGVLRQSAYEIEADGWNSGRVDSSDSIGIVWEGDKLPSSTRIGWRVRVWDEDGNPGAWSERSSFVTGIMSPADWKAKWIGPAASTQADEDMKGARWITGQRDGKGVIALKKSFDFAGARPGEFVEMVHAAIPQHEVLVNGKSCHLYSGHLPRWNYLRFRDITQWLVKGRNEIEVRVQAGDATNAAFVAKFTLPGGKTFVTDASWQGAKDIGGIREPEFSKALCLRSESRSPAFEKAFAVDRPIKSALLHVTGLGFYEASLNGRRIGEKVLDPAPTMFDSRVLYSTYDVTDLLQAGTNTLKVLVGHGWYDVRSIATWDFATAPWRDAPRMIAQLEVTCLDGTKQTVASDDTWLHADSPVLYDCIREGEVVSGEGKGEAVGRCAVVDAPRGALAAEALPGTKVVRTLAPETIKDCGNGTYVVKFPENFAGWVRAKFRGQKKGDVVVIRYDERVNADLTPAEPSVNDGLHPMPKQKAGEKNAAERRTIDIHFRYTASHRACAVGAEFQADRLIATGKAVEAYEPRFTYNGFQYVVLKGLRQAPKAEDIVGCVVMTDFRDIGNFECSDETFNTLMRMAKRAYKSNFVNGYPTDCPHREKNGWTGDASIASELAQYLFENTAAYEKWLKDLCDTQVPSGDICCIAPTSGWGFKWGNGPAWDSALPVVAWNLYVYRNDRRILDLVYPVLKRYLAFTATKADAEGLVKHGLGDWIPVDFKHMPSTELTSSCYYYQALVIASKIAAVLDQNGESAVYAALADRTRKAINARFYKGKGVYDNGGQTAQAFPIAYGIVPAANLDKVAAKLVESIENTGCHVDMGLLGTKHVFRALSRIGRTDLAFKTLVNPTKPSMVAWIQKGGTTLWEDWKNGTSRNHIMFGDFAGWAYQYLAGIGLPETPDSCSAIPAVRERGFRSVVFAPCVIDELNFVTASVDTPFGVYASSWKRVEGTVRYRFTVPAGGTAVLRLPGREDETVGPGTYER